MYYDYLNARQNFRRTGYLLITVITIAALAWIALSVSILGAASIAVLPGVITMLPAYYIGGVLFHDHIRFQRRSPLRLSLMLMVARVHVGGKLSDEEINFFKLQVTNFRNELGF